VPDAAPAPRFVLRGAPHCGGAAEISGGSQIRRSLIDAVCVFGRDECVKKADAHWHFAAIVRPLHNGPANLRRRFLLKSF
jgi:hypothetical protein